MLGKSASALLVLSALASPASGAAYTTAIDIRAGPLSTALQDLGRQTSVELLFDRDAIGSRRSPAIHGRYTAESALQQLLQDTNLRARRASSGVLIVEAQGPPVLAQPDAPVPEILVIGRRSQNSDIRRLETDVQPYHVVSGERLLQAHKDNIDDFFRSRIPANTEVIPPTLSENSETVSEIDLRGLGADQTLVLVDGRRMPAIPLGFFGTRQPDLNAIPLHAIERIETLTGTAGGIFGFGALGGVVNVVLHREYRGVELHGTAGISSRGDSRRLGLEARIGFTPDHGRTDVMLYVSRVRSEPLFTGERDYMARNRALTALLAPSALQNSLPQGGNSVGVFGFGAPLTFRPEYGGGALGSSHTYLPIGFQGTTTDLVASLRQYAGSFDTSLSPDEAATELGSNAATDALIANVRHRFGSNIEVYADALILRNRGQYVSRGNNDLVLLLAGSPRNPFNETVVLTVPISNKELKRQSTFRSTRYTGGIIAGLPLGWRGTAEATFGTAQVGMNSSRSFSTLPILIGPPFGPDVDPFGNWDQFQQEIAGFTGNAVFSEALHNRYREQSLRFAGPLIKTPAGLTTLTLLAEQRKEDIPAETSGGIQTFSASRSSRTRSLYGELKSRLFGEDAPIPLLKQLELQLAVRHDSENMNFSRSPGDPSAGRMHPSFSETVFTAGAKASPFRWLMLRGSYATGSVPPPPSSLIELRETSNSSALQDPKRGNSFVGTEGPFLLLQQGSPDLKTIKAATLSIGAVVTPLGSTGPRLSVDYSRIRKNGDVDQLTDDLVIEHEDQLPGRVTREPLSDADRARGFTGGRITMIDARATNAASRNIDTLDAALNWPFPLFGGGARVYANATVQLRNKQKNLFQAAVDEVGFLNGPLRWRANGGLDWTRGATSIGANVQYFSKYHVYPPGYPTLINDQFKLIQGASSVAAQAYLDLYVSRRFRVVGSGPMREVTIDFGVNNVLDSSPPRESATTLFSVPGYSGYGDPRRRRFELVVSSVF